jgi:hypothetical protein
MARLPCARSMRRATTISPTLPANVRGCGSTRRASCMVSVDAPLNTRPASRFCSDARTTAIQSTPPWTKKRSSSTATVASTIAVATSSIATASARAPSRPTASRNSSPWRS